MTKAQLVEMVADKTGFTKTETAVIIESFLNVVKDVLSDGHPIEIRRFGSFKLKVRKPRTARNPKTGTPVKVKKRVIPVFRPSRIFLEQMSPNMVIKNK